MKELQSFEDSSGYCNALLHIIESHVSSISCNTNEVMLCVGCVVSLLVAALLGDELWRVTVAAAALPATAQIAACLCFLPESPRWLALQGEAGEAHRASAALGLPAPHKGEDGVRSTALEPPVRLVRGPALCPPALS